MTRPDAKAPAAGAEAIGELRHAAETARATNWSPYTGAVVVASVRTTDGALYGGSNVEVANISLSKHAEESALLHAIADGAMLTASGGKQRRCIEAVYVSAAPCGSCRQFIFEFATEDCVVYVADGEGPPDAYLIGDLLPRAFGPEQQLAAGGRTAVDNDRGR